MPKNLQIVMLIDPHDHGRAEAVLLFDESLDVEIIEEVIGLVKYAPDYTFEDLEKAFEKEFSDKYRGSIPFERVIF